MKQHKSDANTNKHINISLIITIPAPRQSRCRGVHACHKQTRSMQHDAAMQTQPHAQAREYAHITAGCSLHFPGSPAQTQKHHPGAPAHSKLCNSEPVNGLARCETSQTPLPEHTHASQYHSRSQHGQGGAPSKRRGAPWALRLPIVSYVVAINFGYLAGAAEATATCPLIH